MARYSSDLNTWVVRDSTSARLDGDCGIITLAVLCGAATGSRGVYEKAADLLTRHGIYDGTGTKVLKLKSLMQKMFGGGTRFTRQCIGMTLDAYLAARPGWSGVAICKHGDICHGIPVVHGVAYNTNNGEWMGYDLIATLRINLEAQ